MAITVAPTVRKNRTKHPCNIYGFGFAAKALHEAGAVSKSQLAFNFTTTCYNRPIGAHAI